VRLIQKWLKAGVLEDGKRIRTEEGTPQGGSASPLVKSNHDVIGETHDDDFSVCALLTPNVYLHYLFDLWVRAAGPHG
jgi:RNA-directed DNA polymerase